MQSTINSSCFFQAMMWWKLYTVLWHVCVCSKTDIWNILQHYEYPMVILSERKLYLRHCSENTLPNCFQHPVRTDLRTRVLEQKVKMINRRPRRRAHLRVEPVTNSFSSPVTYPCTNINHIWVTTTTTKTKELFAFSRENRVQPHIVSK